MLKRFLISLLATVAAVGGSVVVASPAHAAGPYYWYAGGRHTAGSVSVTQAVANMTINNPWVDTDDINHAVTEISIERGSATTRQIVEFGWGVNIHGDGDMRTRLWTGYWVNGVWQGFNVGFIPNCSPSPCAAPNDVLVDYDVNGDWTGSNLPAKQFLVQYTNGAWWFAFDGRWIGHLSTTAFSSATGGDFVAGDRAQFFGEVASVDNNPTCSDMGDMTLPTQTTGAYVSNAKVNNVNANLASVITNSAYYNKVSVPLTSTNTFRYGGGGPC